MRFSNWFRSRKNKRTEEITPGGSIVRRYTEPEKPQVGLTDEMYLEERQQIYDEWFGECGYVNHEIIPLVPHVDVFIYEPNEQRDFYTLVTSGMSDLPMHPPKEAKDCTRAELIMYVREPKEEFLRVLRTCAHYVHDYKTWLWHGHTMPLGDPPIPIVEGSELDTLYFIFPVISPDNSLAERLTIGGAGVELIWTVPITTSECNYKLDYGSDALLDLFQRFDHPLVLDEYRCSLFKKGGPF